MVAPALFVILACATCILLIVILIATSRGKRSARGTPYTLNAGIGKGAVRSKSGSESAGIVRPPIRQGLDTKAVVKAAITDTRLQAAKVANSKSLTDRKVEPMILPPTLVSKEASEKTAACVVATLDPAAPVELPAALTVAPTLVEPASSPVTNESAAHAFATPAKEAAEVKEPAPCFGQNASVDVTNVTSDCERSEVADLAPFPVAANRPVCAGPFRFPVHESAEAAEVRLARATEESALDLVMPQGQETTGSELSQELLHADSIEEFRAPSLLAFYGLSQQPFDVTPDPAYLYRSRVHREAFTALSQGIENLRGFVALIAEPGMGKTTLLNKLMEQLRDSVRVVFLFQTQCNSTELIRHMLTELGVEHDGADMVAMHRALSDVLFEEMLQGRRFVLIVDEAQNLQDSVLETIRLLSNYETTHSKLIQIVLSGQPQLVETLMRPSLVQLRQRIAVVANLEPLDVAETCEYIEHRLRAAGSGDMPVFTRDAMELIAERSQGIPRSINNICFNAMLAGYLQRQLLIDAETVKRVASKLDLELLVRRPQENPVTVPAVLPAPSGELTQLANLLSTALAGKAQPEMVMATGAEDEPRTSLSLTGRLNEKLTSQSWSNKNEFQIQVSLERDYSPGLPIADHYYCRSFYVSEEQAKSLEPGKAVRVKFEQD